MLNIITTENDNTIILIIFRIIKWFIKNKTNITITLLFIYKITFSRANKIYHKREQSWIIQEKFYEKWRNIIDKLRFTKYHLNSNYIRTRRQSFLFFLFCMQTEWLIQSTNGKNGLSAPRRLCLIVCFSYTLCTLSTNWLYWKHFLEIFFKYSMWIKNKKNSNIL